MVETRSSRRTDLDELVRCELPQLYRVAFRLTGNSGEAEDLVAQCLYNATKGWPKFDGKFPRAWLMRILTNVFLTERRMTSRRQTVPLDQVEELTSPSADPHQVASHQGTVEALVQAVAGLSPEHRAVITLCDIEEIPYEEAMLVLDLPRGTLCSRLHRARKQLEVTLRNKHGVCP